MNEKSTTLLGSIALPLGKEHIQLEEIRYDRQAMPLLRIRIREGKRFTIFDIDSTSAQTWAEIMLDWAARCQQSNDA